MIQIGLKPLMKLFQSHAVYNGKEICYRDFIHKVKIELLKEKLVNNPPPQKKNKLIKIHTRNTSKTQRFALIEKKLFGP